MPERKQLTVRQHGTTIRLLLLSVVATALLVADRAGKFTKQTRNGALIFLQCVSSHHSLSLFLFLLLSYFVPAAAFVPIATNSPSLLHRSSSSSSVSTPPLPVRTVKQLNYGVMMPDEVSKTENIAGFE
jgi:hypothetical protein